MPYGSRRGAHKPPKIRLVSNLGLGLYLFPFFKTSPRACANAQKTRIPKKKVLTTSQIYSSCHTCRLVAAAPPLQSAGGNGSGRGQTAFPSRFQFPFDEPTNPLTLILRGDRAAAAVETHRRLPFFLAHLDGTTLAIAYTRKAKSAPECQGKPCCAAERGGYPKVTVRNLPDQLPPSTHFPLA